MTPFSCFGFGVLSMLCMMTHVMCWDTLVTFLRFALWQCLLWKSVTVLPNEPRSHCVDFSTLKPALFLLIFTVCSGMPRLYLCFIACHLNFFSPRSSCASYMAAQPPPSLSFSYQTHTVYTCSHWTLVFSLVFEHGPPGLVVDPVGFPFARVHTHTHTQTLITHIMLTDCMSIENPPTHIHTSAHMHSCMLENIGARTHKDSCWVIGRAGVTGLYSPTHPRSGGDCVMHGLFATWIIKCNKDRVKQG